MTKSPAGLQPCRTFLYIENPTLGVGFRKAYSYEYEIETPFARMIDAAWQLQQKQKEVI